MALKVPWAASLWLPPVTPGVIIRIIFSVLEQQRHIDACLSIIAAIVQGPAVLQV